MRTFFLSICTVVSALIFSSFKPAAPYVQIDSGVTVSIFNVTNASTYIPAFSYGCTGGSNPCRLDLSLINDPWHYVYDEATLLAYLNDPLLFPTMQDKVDEVLRITDGWKPF